MELEIIEVLKKVIADYGDLIYENENQLKALLKDYCNDKYKKEIMSLMLVIEEDIIEKIVESKNKNMLNTHIKLLCDIAPISWEAAEWAVNAWYYALGIISDDDISKYRNNNTEKNEPNLSTDSKESSKLYNFDEITDEQIQASYKILELDNNSSEADIIKSYRKLIKKYYPPKIKDPSLRKLADEKTKSINSAKEMLIGYIDHKQQLKLNKIHNNLIINNTNNRSVNTTQNMNYTNNNSAYRLLQKKVRSTNMQVTPTIFNQCSINDYVYDKAKILKLVFVLLAIGILCLIIAFHNPSKSTNVTTNNVDKTTSQSGTIIKFKDSSIRTVIRETLNKYTGDITKSDLEKLTTLKIKSDLIDDISDLKYCINLTSLDLNNNNISNLSPLRGMTKLTSLNLSRNNITDISPLASLKKLRKLYLKSNKVTNIKSLSYLTKLSILNLSKNQIDNISLLESLKKLSKLYISYNSITDMSVLQNFKDLQYLFVSKDQICYAVSELFPVPFQDRNKCKIMLDNDNGIYFEIDDY